MRFLTRVLQVARPAAALLTLGLALPTAAEDFVTPRPSPGARVQQTVGTTELSISYSRPGVKGRAIWGALVPYDKPWRTGANEATTFAVTDDITVGGQKLAAGTYSFFTLPSAGDWTVIFSRQKELWGSTDYDPKQDALRVTAKPAAAEPVEWMRLGFENLGASSCDLVLRWEKLSVPIQLTVDTNGKTLAAARAALAVAKPDDWRTPYRAASWAFDAGVVPDETANWARAASRRPTRTCR